MSEHPHITALREALVEANKEEEYRRSVFVHPYSNRDAEVEFHKSRGVQRGLAKAIEILLENDGE